jgi:CP family cyanate transporter-like MFS transporter
MAQWWGAAALLLVAANQRTGLAALPPLLPQIEAESGLSPAGAGLLTTVPILAMGLLAPAVPRAAGRFGVDATLLAGLAAVAAGSLLRLSGPAVAALLVGAALIGAGVTTIGALLPGIIAGRHGTRTGTLTGWTTGSLAFGAAAAAAVAVPLADVVGWRAALALWAVPAVLAALAWRSVRDGSRERTPSSAMPVRSPVAWTVVAYFTLGTIGFFSALAWVAPAVVATTGAGDALGGAALAVLTAANVAGSLLGPIAAARGAPRRALLLGAALVGASGIAALAMLPDGATATALTASAVAGFGLGASFGLSLLLLADTAATTTASRGLSAMAFLAAFTLAAPFPTLLGALATWTGGFAAGWWLVAGVVAVSALCVPRLGPGSRGAVR